MSENLSYLMKWPESEQILHEDQRQRHRDRVEHEESAGSCSLSESGGRSITIFPGFMPGFTRNDTLAQKMHKKSKSRNVSLNS